MFLISEAFADSGAPAVMGSNYLALAPYLLILVIFYFLMIRPQQKKLREHKEMLGSLKRGDKVVTSGGIVGTVQKVDIEPNMVSVEIAPDTQVKVIKSTISEVLTKSISDGK